LAGRQYYNALKLAESDINKSGGINGKPVKFYFEDAGSDNGTALNAFVKVIQEHKPVFAFLSSYSTQNSAVAPETSKAKIPVLYAGGADSLANAKNSYMYRIRPADSLSAVAMVRFAHETLKAKKPGIIYVQGDFGQGASDTAAKGYVGSTSQLEKQGS
jgi:branched-chain amino acid transport system substrate-binding protein